MALIDALGRPLRSLRISVTDRCNLRCQYCMPEEEYVWLPREALLRFEEISALVDIFLELGVDKVRLTGGEPLLRRDLDVLVKMLAVKRGLRDLALTTNGILLASQAQALFDAGLHRVTVSLDTLRPDRFTALTRGDSHHKVAEVRFIEYMDVGGATRWSMSRVVTRAEILGLLARLYGRVEPVTEESSAPAERFSLPDGTVFGIISSTTAPFCRSCDRSRLTADGLWYLCLYARTGVDLRGLVRQGNSPDTIRHKITEAWQARIDRGAEERLGIDHRAAFVPVEELRRDPHLEMHTRGG